MPVKRRNKPKLGDLKVYNPERQREAQLMLEQAKQQEQEYIIKPVRIDSKTVVLKKVRKK